MKHIIIVLVAVVLLAVVVWAGEKENLSLTLQYEGLVARFNRAYQALPELKALNEAQRRLPEFKALQDFGKELEVKGLMIKDGKVVDKPKVPAKK